ncbi:hypothetical protein D3C87_1921930 [compost metagenome]
MTKRDAVTSQQGFSQDSIKVEFCGVVPSILHFPEMAQICAIICQRLAHHADVTDDVLMLLAGQIGDLPAGHGDCVAWSDDRVHNGPTVFYKLLKKPGCSPAFLCLRFRQP